LHRNGLSICRIIASDTYGPARPADISLKIRSVCLRVSWRRPIKLSEVIPAAWRYWSQCAAPHQSVTSSPIRSPLIVVKVQSHSSCFYILVSGNSSRSLQHKRLPMAAFSFARCIKSVKNRDLSDIRRDPPRLIATHNERGRQLRPLTEGGPIGERRLAANSTPPIGQRLDADL
jgi:hypothetical protein